MRYRILSCLPDTRWDVCTCMLKLMCGSVTWEEDSFSEDPNMWCPPVARARHFLIRLFLVEQAGTRSAPQMEDASALTSFLARTNQ